MEIHFFCNWMRFGRKYESEVIFSCSLENLVCQKLNILTLQPLASFREITWNFHHFEPFHCEFTDIVVKMSSYCFIIIWIKKTDDSKVNAKAH